MMYVRRRRLGVDDKYVLCRKLQSNIDMRTRIVVMTTNPFLMSKVAFHITSYRRAYTSEPCGRAELTRLKE
jgi:hypothetical protein